MQELKSKKYLGVGALIVLIIAVFSFSGLVKVKAQINEPEFLITWKTNTYVPKSFLNKVLPTDASLVNISFELVDRGKLINLSDSEIYWYLNDELIKGGLGIQEASFRARGVGSQNLRIKIPNYKGGLLMKNIIIPSVEPEVAIIAPYYQNKFQALGLKIDAQPYFFNVTDLNELQFSWQINGQKPKNTGRPDQLNIVLNQGGTDLKIKLNAINPKKFRERASQELNLKFTKN